MWRHIKEWQQEWGRQDEDVDLRWIGPETVAYPGNLTWKIGREVEEMGALSIKKLTQARADLKMRPPPSQKAWERRLGRVKWRKVWKIRSFFTTPRDQATWLKLIHRNLYVANKDPSLASSVCSASGCQANESMLHLAVCGVINVEFWDKIAALLDKLGIPRGTGPRFWITGERSDGKYIDVEGAGILFLAWRCLYAETVRARINGEQLKLKHAYARVVLMSISRLKAQGQKWYRWYSRTRGISEHKVKTFPRRYRKRCLMTTTATAEYEISDALLREYDSVKQDRL